MDPHQIAGGCAETEHSPAAFDDVHEAVGDDGRRKPAAVVRHRVAPDRSELPDVGPVDLGERTVGMAVVGPPE